MNEELKNEYYRIEPKDYESIISFYEDNLSYLDNLSDFNDVDEIGEIAKCKLQYIQALESKKRYTKADTYLRHVDILLQKLINTNLYDEINERYLFFFAIINYRLKKYDKSLGYFNQLVLIDPENDVYKEWIDGIKDELFTKKSRLVAYVAFVLIFLDFFLERIFNTGFGEYFYLYAFAVMLLGVIVPEIKKLLKRININLN